MSSSNSTPVVPQGMLGLMMLACVLPVLILFALVQAGFSPPPMFVFFLVVICPLMALYMTVEDQKADQDSSDCLKIL